MTDEDDTAALDLSIAFFSAIVMLFAFVAFQITRAPEADPPVTLRQPDIGRAIQPPTWAAVTERGSWAVYDGARLTLLNLDTVTAGMEDIMTAYDGDDGYQSLTLHGDDDPRAFALTLSFRPDAIPAPWRGEAVTPAPDAPCPETGRRLIRTYVAGDAPDLTPLIAYGARCNRQIAPLALREPGPSGRVSVRIGLSPASYSAEAMFR